MEILVILLFMGINSGIHLGPVHGVVTREPKNKTVFIGQDATFTCGSTHEDAVAWFVKPVGDNRYYQIVYNFQGLVPTRLEYKFKFAKISKEEQILTIRNVDYEDAGTYRCVDEYALHWTGQPERVRWAELVVRAPSTLTAPPHDTLALTGSDVNFTCGRSTNDTFRWDFKPVGEEFKQIVFTDEDIIIPSALHKYSFTMTSNGEHVLTIQKITYKDAGTYRCIDDHRDEWVNYPDKYGEAELIVTARVNSSSKPSSAELIVDDICNLGLPMDYIEVDYEMKYKGNTVISLNVTGREPDDCNMYEAASIYSNISQTFNGELIELRKVEMTLKLLPKLNATRCTLHITPYSNNQTLALVGKAAVELIVVIPKTLYFQTSFRKQQIKVNSSTTVRSSVWTNIDTCQFSWENHDTVWHSKELIIEPQRTNVTKTSGDVYTSRVNCTIRGKQCLRTTDIISVQYVRSGDRLNCIQDV